MSRTKGNQQGATTISSGTALWYLTGGGTLVQISLAQQVYFLSVDGGFEVVASYNDSSEVVLAVYGSEADARDALSASDRTGIERST